MSRDSTEKNARRHELEAAERLYEEEMSIRIITESALIRSEWDAQTRASRQVQKPIEVNVRSAQNGVGRRNGVVVSR